jgi:RNA polymerase sigma-70 factor, ECF subfamily
MGRLQANMGSPDVTTLLRAWSGGDQGARDRLVPLVYAELHKRAAAYLRRECARHAIVITCSTPS